MVGLFHGHVVGNIHRQDLLTQIQCGSNDAWAFQCEAVTEIAINYLKKNIVLCIAASYIYTYKLNLNIFIIITNSYKPTYIVYL